jgi:photosystem II stability/assembly factor-like uncharacterized protein
MPARAHVALAACLLFLGLASPAAAAEWIWTGPDGGEVLSIELQPGSSTVLYAGGRAGLFKSVDAGASWQLLVDGPAAAVLAIGIDPADTSTVYAGLRFEGLLKSTDGGAHWTDAGQGLPDPPFGPSVHALAVRGGAVYAGTEVGLYRSVDGGASWQAFGEGLPASRVLSLEVDPSQPATIYAGIERHGLFRSTDGGAHWTPAGNFFFTAGDASDVEVSPVSSAIVYGGTSHGVARSADAGASWSLSQDPGNVNALAVHPTLAGTVYAGANNGMFKSTDGGVTWARVTEGLTDTRVLALAIDPAAPGKLWAGTNHDFQVGGVFQTTDGAEHWTWRSRGLSGEDVAALAFDPHTPGTLFAALGFQGLARSRDQGRTWTMLPLPSLGFPGFILEVKVDPETPSVVYATTTGFGPLLKSTDGGDTWAPFGTFPGFLPVLYELEIDRGNPNVFYGGSDDGFYKSTDRGATWVQSPSFRDVSPRQIEIAPSSPATLYSVAEETVVGSPPIPRNLLLRSLNAGQTWELLDPPHEPARLAISPSDSRTVYIATLEDGIFRTTDGGSTWEPLGSQLPRAATVAIAPAAPEILYTAVPGRGVLASPDGGASWTPVGEGLERFSFTGFIALDPHDPERLWTGVGKRSLATFLGQDVCEPGPTTLCLRGGRFRVEAAWKDFQGNAGVGRAVSLTGETGALWFFQEDNLELVVKVLDGRGLNGRFWVFVASLTSVELTLTVTDTETGRQKVYRNPPGHMASFGDTETF